MRTLDEIEAAVDNLPPSQQRVLLRFLTDRLEGRAIRSPKASSGEPSVLEIPPVSAGEVLRPFSPGDDLLGEMLEGRA